MIPFAVNSLISVCRGDGCGEVSDSNFAVIAAFLPLCGQAMSLGELADLLL